MKKCYKCGTEYKSRKCPECQATNKRAFYIFSYDNNGLDDHDWFIGEDLVKDDEQEMEVANFMVENYFADDRDEALKRIIAIYKQDTEILINNLKGR